MIKADEFMDKVVAEIRQDAAQYKTKVQLTIDDVISKEDIDKMKNDLKKIKR